MLNGVCVDIPDCTRSQFYTKNDNLCHPCKFPSNCLDGSCQTATDAVCEVCETGFALINNACQLIPNCTSTQYYKKITNLCNPCPLAANCATGFCSNPSTLFCTQCLPGFVNMNGCVPVPNCTGTQFLDTVLNVCQDCTKVLNCQDYICTSDISTVCVRCTSGFVVRGQVCSEIPICKTGTFLDMTTLSCPVCPLPANCKTVDRCTKSTDSTCAVCNDGFILKNGVCVPPPTCIKPQILNPETNKCADCADFNLHCITALCTSFENAEHSCIKCKPGFIAEDGDCYAGGNPPPAGSGSTDPPAYDFAHSGAQATETTTVSKDASGATTVTTSSDDSNGNHGFAIAVGVFAGVAVALLITLVVVVVMRTTSGPEKV